MAGGLMAGLFGLLFGASAGSFLATWWLRRDRCEDWIWGRSRCDRCGAVLAARDLLPIVSWLVCRGRCRRCQAPIDPRHVVVEGMAAVVVGLAFFRVPLPAALLVALLGLLLLALALVDLVSLELPDSLLIAVAGLGLLALLLREADLIALPLPSLVAGLLGAAGAAAALGLLRAVHRWLCGREGLGTGDLALAAAGGLWLGPTQLPLWFLLAGTFGLLFAVGCGALRDRTRPVPFGPALGLALFVLVLRAARG
jgi:leader peptidase (prepilin peptidase)/N-methyltransferase